MIPRPLSAQVRQTLARMRADAGDHARGECIVLAAAGELSDELFIYGDIGDYWWDDDPTSAKAIAEKLALLNAPRLVVRINSYGGAVNDGVAIYNAIQAHKVRTGATVTTRVDGIAASIASLIAQAGDERIMPANTSMMIHAPWTMALGSAGELEAVATVLRHYEDATATSYIAHAGLDGDEFKAEYFDGSDHYLTAAEAVAAGFADRVAEDASADLPADVSELLTTRAQALGAGLPRFAPTTAAAFAAAMPRMQARPIQPLAGADDPQPAAAGGNSTGVTIMPQEVTTPAADVQAVQAAAQTAATEALATLRTRNAEISALATPHFGNSEVRAYHDRIISEADPAVTTGAAGQQILAILARQAAPLNGNPTVVAGADETDQRRAAMTQAISARAGMAKADRSNPYRGFTMAEMARECVVRAGVNTAGRDRLEIVGLAFTHSTSDFPNILGDTARAAVLRGYQMVEEQIDAFTRAISVPDFKPSTLVGLGVFSDLLKVPEGGEYKYGTFSELSQSIQLATYGRLFSITRQAIINDQLGLFDDVGVKMGQAAKRTVANAVYTLLTSNPTLADGKALFHADHDNLLTGAAISTTAVDGMRSAMALQTGPGGESIRVPLKTLVTPIALGGLARTVRESQTEVSGSKNLTTPNIVRGTFDVIDDPRLDASSSTAWYGVADPGFVDGIVVGYLDGNQQPYLEQHEGFTVDGIAWKVRIDASAAVADYRGIDKNPGA